MFEIRDKNTSLKIKNVYTVFIKVLYCAYKISWIIRGLQDHFDYRNVKEHPCGERECCSMKREGKREGRDKHILDFPASPTNLVSIVLCSFKNFMIVIHCSLLHGIDGSFCSWSNTHSRYVLTIHMRMLLSHTSPVKDPYHFHGQDYYITIIIIKCQIELCRNLKNRKPM